MSSLEQNSGTDVQPSKDIDVARNTHTSQAVQLQCYHCRKTGTQEEMKMCSGCKRAVYCSASCQKEAWTDHRPKCKEYRRATRLSALHHSCGDGVSGGEHDSDGGCSCGSLTPTSPVSPFGASSKGVQVGNGGGLRQPRSASGTAAGTRIHIEAGSVSDHTAEVKQAVKKLLAELNSAEHLKTEAYPADTVFTTCRLRYNKVLKKCEVPMNKGGHAAVVAIARVFTIPLDKLRIICKGKQVKAETICDQLKENDLIMLMGQQDEDMTGLDPVDVALIMGQMKVDKNLAIRGLRHTNSDLIESIRWIAERS
eukprot:GFYU01017812.1.p1 GENE.GFYU01017812.1~~GFYU01017812.1.p1  ORF type:complete len:310 (-),score=65.21 GFYU01017812.1:65-994(-)